ncbi:MAG TPA: FAD-binding oxidoreductase [bacterium]|nr:FAD-binding oxidoreductase [bacterium]
MSADAKLLDQYSVTNPLLTDRVPPVRVERPRDVAELKEMVHRANGNGAGLVAMSSASPHTRGIACAAPHALVDLSSWKKIGFIDRRNRVAMIEPGVTYGELLAALAPHGLTLSMPLAPRSGKSVLAAVMDREPTTWPNKQWDIADPLASAEIVFGTGDIFRTGAAGGPGTLEQQRAAGGAQKSPMGPSQTDFQRVVQGSQGAMGIATWITVRAEVKPTIQEPRLLGADALEKLIPFVYDVQRPWLGEHSFIMDRAALRMFMAGKDAVALPAYVCLQNVAGFERRPRERVDYQLQDIAEIAARHGLKLTDALGNVTAQELLNRATRPCGERDWRHALSGHCLSVFFLTTLDRARRFIGIFQELAEKSGVESGRTGVYLQPVVQNHACHVELLVPFDPAHAGEVERMRALEQEAVASLMDAGAFFSRPYGAAEKIAMEKNPLHLAVLKKIKNIFDPGRALGPGRLGL